MKRRFDIWSTIAPDGLLHQSVMVVLLAWAITLLPLNVEFLAPIEIALREFEYTDIITSQIQDDESPRIDTSIVLVNIGNASRTELAMTLDALYNAGAACIGVDAMFTSPVDSLGAAALAAVIRDRPNIVMGEVLENRALKDDEIVYNGCERGVLRRYPGITFANVNLPASSTFKTIRYWEPTGSYGDTVSPSIVLSLARRYLRDTSILTNLDEELFIKYQRTRTWFTAEWSDCVSGQVDPEMFRGRIVLLGFLGSRIGDTMSIEDRFFTPLNRSYVGRTWPDAYGVEIHATVLSMLIHDDVVSEYDGIYDVIIAFLITISILALYRTLTERFHSVGETVARFTQVIILLGVFSALTVLLLDHNRILPIDISVACAVLCLDLATIYDGTAGSIYSRIRRCVRSIRVSGRNQRTQERIQGNAS
jgi:CHASE2 domain-containing sensor protein